MAGRKEYIIAHPNGVDHIRAWKGGKVPTHATWAYFTADQPHHSEGAGWVHLGWSFQTTLADAQAKALPDFRKHGARVTATRALPASL
ncbi:hypothetical protein ACF1A5_11390 [Streptomyces sp. NPDC014864]|uniref:hypothetical protein n=1 Tax=Streptomyces sp. NPDC014864 TaxID=3364924 RepID=UPI003703329C